MIEKKFGIDFKSEEGALTLRQKDVTEGLEENGTHKRTHNSGWTIEGLIHEDYYIWVNEFKALHPKYGKVYGDFESIVYANSEEGFKHFYEHHTPEAWNYEDI